MLVRSKVVGLLIVLASTGVLAQSSIDRSFKVTGKNCDGVQWSEAALKAYPNIASACEAVEERNGKSYVRFAGEVVRNIDRGKQLDVRFKRGGEMKLTPPPEMTVYMDGRKTPVRNLQRGDELTFYVPEDRLVAQFHEDETPATQYVVVPIVYREVDLVKPEERAQTAARLPDTASELTGSGLLGVAVPGLAVLCVLWRHGRS